MSPEAIEAQRQHAAQAGRKLLSRHLPSGLAGWIIQLADHDESPESVLAWAGALTAIATALERSFQVSGSEVRDLILRIHRMLTDGGSSSNSPDIPELEPIFPWMKHLLEQPAGPVSPRIILLQWVDTASERLTLRRYHRPDYPLHHARTLLLAPLRHLTGILPESSDEVNLPAHSPQPGEELALVILHFVDLLDADRLGLEGKNRISRPDSAGFGGFYGISENVQPPSRKEQDQRTRDLKAEAKRLREGLEPTSPFYTILSEMESALESRIRTKAWPRKFIRKPISERLRKRPFWIRWLNR